MYQRASAGLISGLMPGSSADKTLSSRETRLVTTSLHGITIQGQRVPDNVTAIRVYQDYALKLSIFSVKGLRLV